jgi:hypothetical protein
MSVAEDLGKLIVRMNPYTDGSEDAMELHTFVPAYTTGAPDPTSIWMEMDTYSPGDWTFKGQPHHIDTAIRIAYRWKKVIAGETIWITDYLLIGYEGSNGG